MRRNGSSLRSPTPCPIAPYLLDSASGPSRAVAPAAARPALRSGPTCSRGPARAPLPRGSLPGPSLAAAVSAAAAASSPSSPAPGRASPCPPWEQRQPRCTEGRSALGARWVPGVRSRARLRRAPLCASQAPGLRALPGLLSPGSEVARPKVSALSGARSGPRGAVRAPVRDSLRPPLPAAPAPSQVPCHNAKRCRSIALLSPREEEHCAPRGGAWAGGGGACGGLWKLGARGCGAGRGLGNAGALRGGDLARRFVRRVGNPG